MSRTKLKQWCKDAGPIGPALWAFDGLVHAIVDVTEAVEQRPVAESDKNAESLGLILVVSMIAALGIIISLILFFPH